MSVCLLLWGGVKVVNGPPFNVSWLGWSDCSSSSGSPFGLVDLLLWRNSEERNGRRMGTGMKLPIWTGEEMAAAAAADMDGWVGCCRCRREWPVPG